MSSTISLQDINKLRSQTGAGLTDCKKALEESSGDFEKAIEYLRKKGQKIATSRQDRESTEGAVLAAISPDKQTGYLMCLACETDFVAKNQNFVSFAEAILKIVVEKSIDNIDNLLKQEFENKATIQQKIDEMVGRIGEKIYISKLEIIKAPQVVPYIHGANRLGVLVGLNQDNQEEVGKNIAMQIAAMNPLSVDEHTIDAAILAKEENFIKEQMATDPSMSSKPPAIVEKISKGKLQAFIKDNTLLSQAYVKDSNKNVKAYLSSVSEDLKVVAFQRVALG